MVESDDIFRPCSLQMFIRGYLLIVTLERDNPTLNDRLIAFDPPPPSYLLKLARMCVCAGVNQLPTEPWRRFHIKTCENMKEYSPGGVACWVRSSTGVPGCMRMVHPGTHSIVIPRSKIKKEVHPQPQHLF